MRTSDFHMSSPRICDALRFQNTRGRYIIWRGRCDWTLLCEQLRLSSDWQEAAAPGGQTGASHQRRGADGWCGSGETGSLNTGGDDGR